MLALTFSVLAGGAATFPSLYANGTEVVHVVAKGQTLGRIAKRYHTTVAALREVNDLRPGERLRPGISLVIPEKGKEKEAAKRAEALRGGDSASVPARVKKGKVSGHAGKDDPAIAHEPFSDRTYARKPKHAGLVHLVRGSEHADVHVLTRHGRLLPSSLEAFSRMLRYFPTNAKTAIDPRLVTMVGMVSDHFGGRPLTIVSGFRPYSPTQYTPHSNHNVGHAMDFRVDGVPNTVLRDFCQTFRNAGVGYYPNSTFVHLDARSGRTTWVDYSHAGEPPTYDTPSSRADADEAARDVSDTPSGSPSTQLVDPQEVDSSKGNSGPASPQASSAPSEGQLKPVPSASSSSAAPAPASAPRSVPTGPLPSPP
jgi:uncharacterized protein YcbK (DUF882 family)